MEALTIIGSFLYELMHHHPYPAILMGISLVVAGRGHWLLRLFIAVLLIAAVHDYFTGQLRW
jgi:hypothetical protein